MRLAKLTEKRFMNTVVQFAKLHGWLLFHTFDARRSVPGFPDLVMLKGTRLVVVELKVGKGKTTVDQDRWLESFRRAGVETYLWNETCWDEIDRVLGRTP